MKRQGGKAFKVLTRHQLKSWTMDSGLQRNGSEDREDTHVNKTKRRGM